jgi:hypothetical protein
VITNRRPRVTSPTHRMPHLSLARRINTAPNSVLLDTRNFNDVLD